MNLSTNGMADLLLTGGKYWTAGLPAPRLGAVAVAGGRIAFIGPSDEAAVWRGPRTEVVDCSGRLILPGFHDAHLHPLIGAMDQLDCSLVGLGGWPEYERHIQAWLRDKPHLTFVRGNGWVEAGFAGAGPHRQLLDLVIPDRPAFFKAGDGHSGWFNSAALRLGEITRDTPDPEGGVIERDPVTGEPTGLMREWPAMKLVTDRFPEPTAADYLTGARLFLRQAAEYGLTAIQDGQGKAPFPGVYAALEREGELTLRVRISRRFSPRQGLEQLAETCELRQRHRSDRFSVGPLKIFLDGVVEGHTAVLLDPYTDRPDCCGSPMWEAADWLRRAPELDRQGWQFHFHAVGDGAVRLALDGIAAARAVNGARDARHQIAHADLIADADLARFADLGVVVNISPSWFYRDANWPGITLPALGEERSRRLYRWRDLQAAHAPIACSSDWPFGGDAITCHPLEAIQTALTRRGVRFPGAEPLNPSQAATLPEVLTGFTQGAAWATFRDNRVGSLQPGLYADLAVLDQDLFALPPEAIHHARVLLTLVEGKTTFRRASF